MLVGEGRGSIRDALEPVGLPMPTKISKPYVDHFRKFYCDTAASGFAPKALELAVDFFGSDRVLFGSDAPFDVQDGRIFISETLRSIEAMKGAYLLSVDDRRKINAWDNACHSILLIVRNTGLFLISAFG